jgi:uncharacterized glyoxalase superfamily protein PhnB
VTAFREAFPIITVDDVARTTAFYCATFGFEEGYRHEDEYGEPDFVFLRLDPLGIGVARRDDEESAPFALWIYAEDADGVDEAAARLRAAGAREVLEPTDQEWGERLCTFVDEDGTLLHVGARA